MCVCITKRQGRNRRGRDARGLIQPPDPRTGDRIPGPAIFVRSCSRSPAYGTCRLSGTISFAESWKTRIPTGAVLFFRRVRGMPLNGEPHPLSRGARHRDGEVPRDLAADAAFSPIGEDVIRTAQQDKNPYLGTIRPQSGGNSPLSVSKPHRRIGVQGQRHCRGVRGSGGPGSVIPTNVPCETAAKSA